MHILPPQQKTLGQTESLVTAGRGIPAVLARAGAGPSPLESSSQRLRKPTLLYILHSRTATLSSAQPDCPQRHSNTSQAPIDSEQHNEGVFTTCKAVSTEDHTSVQQGDEFHQHKRMHRGSSFTQGPDTGQRQGSSHLWGMGVAGRVPRRVSGVLILLA